MDVDKIKANVRYHREERFDQAQNRAVDAILDDWNSSGDDFVFPIVDGPPGTGKTIVGAVAAAQYLTENSEGRIAYLCYTHFAADEGQKKLKELDLPEAKILRLTPNAGDTDWKRGIVGYPGDLESLDEDARRKVKESNILLGTLHSSRKAFKIHKGRTHVRLMIDEFSQVSTPMWFATLARARSEGIYPEGYVLLGDPYQLPVVTTQPHLRPNIGSFVRSRKPYSGHELEQQHRMHDDICQAVNSLRDALRAPYHLKSSEKVKDRDLEEMGYTWRKRVPNSPFSEILDPSHPLVIANTETIGTHSRCFPSQSLRNEGEAKIATELAILFHDSFSNKKGEPLSPMILSPYSAQVGKIRQDLPKELHDRCTTIFRSQGREYPCVIISFVWNDPKGFIGFLKEPQLRAQVYVGCSRAQAKLVLLYSRRCFVGKGNADFDLLDRTTTAHKVDLR